MRLAGKAALVTGAATAKRFAREGALVAVNDATAEGLEAVASEVRAAGARALVVAGDVAKKADCERLVQETVRAFGRLDILINNAKYGVTVNAIAPGPVMTRMLAGVPDPIRENGGMSLGA